MATTQTIDATIFASSHPDIAKRTSISGVLFSSFMLLVGILAFASTFELEDRSSTVSMALMVFGTKEPRTCVISRQAKGRLPPVVSNDESKEQKKDLRARNHHHGR